MALAGLAKYVKEGWGNYSQTQACCDITPRHSKWKIWSNYGSSSTVSIKALSTTDATTNITTKYPTMWEDLDGGWRTNEGMRIIWDGEGNTIQYITDDITTDYFYNEECPPWNFKSKPTLPKDRLREIIQSRMTPAIIIRRQGDNRIGRFLKSAESIQEERARKTLCRVVGEQKFQSFLKNGFVIVKNPLSGKVYQIFPGHGLTCVYENGKMINRLCIVLRGQFAPTDSVIVRYLLAINNERKLWDMGISNGPVYSRKPKTLDNRPLSEIYKELKASSSAA